MDTSSKATDIASVGQVSLILDHREGRLKDLLADTSIPYTCQNLDVGDVVLLLDGKEWLVFERKTMSDLLASINDGRYRSQKERLLHAFAPQQVFYILEGACPFHVCPKTPQDKIVHGAIINTMLRDHVGVFYTRNVEETCHLLQCIFTRLQSDPSKYKIAPLPQELVPKPTHMTRTMDPTRCWVNQLCQVPDVSLKTAEAIAQRYPTLQAFYEAFRGKSSSQKLIALKELATTDSKGKSRKLSSRVISNLLTLMLGDHDGPGENHTL